MKNNIQHINGTEDDFRLLLEERLEIPFQFPYLQAIRFDDVGIIHSENAALIVSAKENVTQIARPLGEYREESIHQAFECGLIRDKVYLDGWSFGSHLYSCIEGLHMAMDSARIAGIEDLIFLLQDPKNFPEKLTGKKYQSIRTAQNRMIENGFVIRELKPEDLPAVKKVADKWFQRKISKGYFFGMLDCYSQLPLYQEALSIFDPHLLGQQYRAYGSFNEYGQLRAFQSYIRFGESVIPLTRMSMLSSKQSQECLDAHSLRHWKNEGVRRLFRGSKSHLPESLHKYNSKFGTLYENPTVRCIVVNK